MTGQWKEMVRLTFKGERYRDHALDLSAVGELRQFQVMVSETAKALWRAANPNRERLPKRFEERTRLCLRRIEEGSAVAPLEVYIEEPETPELFDREPGELGEAISLAYRVFRAIDRNESLPENFPKALVPEYAKWGEALGEDEAVEIARVGEEPARLTRSSRSRLSAFADMGHEDHLDVTGEVLEADVRQRRFQLWLDEKTAVTVGFSEEQEEEVTKALKEHKTLRLHLIGRAEFSPLGRPNKVLQVDRWEVIPLGEARYDEAARPIEEILAELGRDVPLDEWKKLPPDLTDNVDHYLYGTPKQ